jgi:hypothetical protein
VADRVFLDANILYAAANSPASGLRAFWKLPETALLTSPYAADEVQRNLARIRHIEHHILLVSVTLVSTPPAETPLPAGLELPAKDAPIFLAAAAARSTHLVTSDKRHFGTDFGTRFGGILIVSPHQYLESRRER